jgi:hypothetical protein
MWAPSWAILNYSLDSYFFSFLECLGANLGAAEANPQTAAGLRALPKFNIGTAASLRQGGSQAGEESSAGPFLFTKGKEFHRSSEASRGTTAWRPTFPKGSRASKRPTRGKRIRVRLRTSPRVSTLCGSAACEASRVRPRTYSRT